MDTNKTKPSETQEKQEKQRAATSADVSTDSGGAQTTAEQGQEAAALERTPPATTAEHGESSLQQSVRQDDQRATAERSSAARPSAVPPTSEKGAEQGADQTAPAKSINPRLNTGYNASEQPRERGTGGGYRYGRPSGRERSYRPRSRVYFRKRVDKIKTYNLRIDYKEPDNLRRFISDKGKILPRRITGTSAKNQRRLVRQIKRARFLALLPMG